MVIIYATHDLLGDCEQQLKGLKIKEFIDPTGIKQYLTKPSKDHHINLKSSVREEKIGRAI